jgi:hypothetical protein
MEDFQVDVASVIRQRLEDLGVAQVTESYISLLLTRKKHSLRQTGQICMARRKSF